MKIAIQGELGSFSHQAALRLMPDADIVPCSLSAEAFERLRKGEVDAIMIPIENTLAGSVVEHYDLLREHSVYIERETVIRIEHNVIGTPASKIEQVQRVYSHPVALAQCRSFFQQHPGIEPVAFYDTAGAVKQIVRLQDRHSAAIAGIQAADIHGSPEAAEQHQEIRGWIEMIFLCRGYAGALVKQLFAYETAFYSERVILYFSDTVSKRRAKRYRHQLPAVRFCRGSYFDALSGVVHVLYAGWKDGVFFPGRSLLDHCMLKDDRWEMGQAESSPFLRGLE